MSTATLEYSAFAEELYSVPMRARILAKVVEALTNYFTLRAAAMPAWPVNYAGDPPTVAAWLAPGRYTLEHLQAAFAPRYKGNRRVPDPAFQIVAATVIETVSGMVKTLLILPEQDGLRESAEEEGTSVEELQQLVMGNLGTEFCTYLVSAALEYEVALDAGAIASAATRGILAEVTNAQERQHYNQAIRADQEKYGRLLKKWRTVSGDIYSRHITIDSPLAEELATWLQTLSPADASVFLRLHNASAKIAAGHILSPELIGAIAEASEPTGPAPYPGVYNTLRETIAAILTIPGYRRITVTTAEDKFVRIDIDTLNRVGLEEPHKGYLVNLLLTGLISHAGVMVRALQDEKINVFRDEESRFVEMPVKFLYGILLDHGRTEGMTAERVEISHRTDPTTGDLVPREPSLRCMPWPTLKFVGKKSATKGSPR